MNRTAVSLLIVAGWLFSPEHAVAQLDVQVVLTWERGPDGWVSYEPVYAPRREVVYYERTPAVVYYETPRQRVRVPPGHLPPPGRCRLWLPGVPPGHQPPPERCENLFGARHLPPHAVIVGSPDHEHRYVDDRYYDDDRGRGRGRGRGRR
jgi:hypothetical protein